jgi:type II secretory ATPase GspE/PulE/Tfp pilus assembly ATPase PilB-like protein
MDIKKRALELGMTTLRQAGIESIEAGMTTVEEVMNYT